MRVLISGISGQDGSYLKDIFRSKNTEVYGIKSVQKDSFTFICSEQSLDPKTDMYNPMNLEEVSRPIFAKVLDELEPDYIFHLATVHHSSQESNNLDISRKRQVDLVNIEMTKQFIKWTERHPNSRLFIALSSKMYAPNKNSITKINENSMRCPQNYYALSKSISWDMANKSRTEFGTKISSGILFNHTSSRSKTEFIIPILAQKINACLKLNLPKLEINNFDSLIDLTHAKEVTDCILEVAEKFPCADFVIGSGNLVSIKDLVKSTLIEMNLRNFPLLKSIRNDENLGYLVSDITKATELLGWKPTMSPQKILLEMIQTLNKNQ